MRALGFLLCVFACKLPVELSSHEYVVFEL